MDGNKEERVLSVQISRSRSGRGHTYVAVWTIEELPDEVVHYVLDRVRECTGRRVVGMDGWTAIQDYGECQIGYDEKGKQF